MSCRCAAQRGITLIELMLGIALLGIIATLTLPSFTAFLDRSRLDGAIKALDADLQWARGEAVKRNAPEPEGPPRTMLEAMRDVLRARLADDARVSIMGQDIEDPKGDVFGLTRGLSTEFPGRVTNAPLSESTIVGTAIGRALAGGRPIAMVQFADFLPLRKVVPIATDCIAGTGPSLLPLTTRRGHTFMAGALVCYEDVFPELAREHALAGADVLVVITNDAWYGREAGAYQHAAHSVLLAAATGLPVVRCGNAGWSGTIDSLGRAFPLLDQGSIYFRGSRATIPVSLPRDRQSDTFWVRHGDWAVGRGGLLFALTYIWRRRRGA